MVDPRWKKVLADLWGNKLRSLLAALSIAAGVFAIGFVASTYLILQRDIPADFLAANPRAGELYSDGFDDQLVAAVRRMPGVAAAEGRSSVSLKLLGQDGSGYALRISRIPAIEAMQIDQLRLEAGAPQLKEHEIYLERQVAKKLGYTVGDGLPVLLADGSRRELRIAGLVQDVTGESFLFQSQANAFASRNTLVWLGGPGEYTRLIFTASEPGDVAQVRALAESIGDRFEASGRHVYSTRVSQPGQHPSQQLLTALLALMGGLGLLSLLLSTFLVINTVSAVMSQQVRQIGVMKAVGATVGQIAGLYLALVLAFGLAALLLAVPAAAAASYGMCYLLAAAMNVNLGPFTIPPASLALQAAVGLGAPLLGALAPVVNGARLTVREAISSYGLNANRKPGMLERLVDGLRGLPRPLLLSIRNTFRRTGRLALTLITLALGGAIFISVFGVRDAINAALDRTFGYTLTDVNAFLARPDRMEQLEPLVMAVPGVRMVEGWVFDAAQVMSWDEKESIDVQIIAPPAHTQLIQPALTTGRWLLPDDGAALVVGNSFTRLRPETRVGERVLVRIAEQPYDFTIVGIYEMAGNPASPMVFTNLESYAALTGKNGQVTSLRVVTDRSEPARQAQVLRALEAQFKAHGIQATLQTGYDTTSQQTRPVGIFVMLLVAMALVIALVGGLGLAGTMSMNVLERRREIGVMRSIGAVDGDIQQLVVVEGVLIGLISWGLAALGSAPVTRLLDRAVGQAMFNLTLEYVLSLEGLLLWLALVTIIAAVASLLPARGAVRLTVRDILAYE